MCINWTLSLYRKILRFHTFNIKSTLSGFILVTAHNASAYDINESPNIGINCKTV